MRLKVTRNFKFADLLDSVLPTERDMRQAGEELAQKIKDRTRAGLDENDRPFAPLTRSTERTHER